MAFLLLKLEAILVIDDRK